MNIPENLYYTPEHEWLSVEGDIATIGITDFAQGELGDIVFVDIDTQGENLDQNAVFGTVDAVKTVSDLFLPLAGEILEVNAGLEDSPESVNQDPYGAGWMVKVKLADTSQLSSLLKADAYKELINA